jgi:hypothetical protein
MRLVMLHHGEPGRVKLLDAWVGDRKAYEAACPNDRSLVASLLLTAL